MKTKVIASLIILVLVIRTFTIYAQPTVTQEWVQRHSGTDSIGGGGFAIDAHKHTFVAGVSFDSTGIVVPTVFKYSSNGTLLWTASYNATTGTSFSQNSITSVIANNQCEVYVSGTLRDNTNLSHFFILKFNGAGVFQWIQKLNGEGKANSMFLDNMGNIYAAGYITDSATANTIQQTQSMVLVKYSSSGQQLWMKKYDNGGSELGMELTPDNNGNILVTGIGTPPPPVIVKGSPAPPVVPFVFTVKYDDSGNQLWAKSYSALIDLGNGFLSSFLPFSHIVALSDGSAIVATSAQGTTNVDFLILKYDSAGDLQWNVTYNATNGRNDYLRGLKTDAFDNIYLAGSSVNQSTGKSEILTAAFSAQGNLLWNSIYHGATAVSDEPFALSLDNLGNLYIAGATYPANGPPDYLTIKYNSTGILQWEKIYVGPAGGPDFALALKATANDVIYVTGLSGGSTTPFDFATVKYSSPCTLTANAGSDTSLCSGQSTTLTASATGGTTPFSFNWGNGETTASTNVSPTANTNYKVTVTDNNGCTSKDSVQITVNALPNADAGADKTIFEGQSVQIGSTPIGGYTYSWEPATALSDANVANPQASPVVSTTYTLTVLNGNGCTATDVVTVTVIPPTIIIDTNLFTYAEVFKDTIVHIIWDKHSNNSIYKYTIEKSLDGITFSPLDSIETVNLIDILVLPDSLIDSYGGIMFSTESNQGFIYNEININFKKLFSNGYRVKMNTTNNEIIYSKTFLPVVYKTISEEFPPVKLFPFCPPVGPTPPVGWISTGLIYTQTIIGNDGYCCLITYGLYENPNQISCSPGPCIENSKPPIIQDCLCFCTYDPCCQHYCSQFTQCGCYLAWQPCSGYYNNYGWFYDVIDATNLSIIPQNPSICSGQSVTLSLNHPLPVNGQIIWSTGANTPTITVSPTATSFFYATVTIDGCEFFVSTWIYIVPPPVITVTPANSAICSGNGVTLTACCANSFTWSPSNGLSSTTGATVFANPTGTKTYTVVGTVNGCSGTGFATINILQGPSVNILASDFCEGEANKNPIAIINGGNAPFTYLWNNGQTGQSATGLSAGINNLSVTVTDANGCKGSNEKIINIFPAPIVELGPNFSFCQNAILSANLTGGTPPYYYIWSNNSQSQSINVNASGNYTVFIVDANGCTDSDEIIITKDPPISITFATTNTNCGKTGTGTVIATATGGTSPFTYLWSNGQTGATATGLKTGNYYVTVTDAIGCIGTGSVTITNYPPPTATITSSSPQPLMCESKISFFANPNPTGTYTYKWSTNPSISFTGQSTSAILISNWPVGTTSGIVTVTVTDNHGCSATTSINVEPCCLTTPVGGTVFLNNAKASNYGASFTGSILYINGVFKIDQNFSISKCLINMGKDGRIEIPNTVNNVQLIISCTQLTAGCGEMWDGIYVNPGSAGNNSLLMEAPACSTATPVRNPILEYAKNGVVSVNGGKYTVWGYTFRNNYIGIDVRPFAANHTGLVYNCTFKTQGTGLISPMSGKAHIGIQVNEVQNLLIGVAGTTTAQNNHYKNVFDNLHFGIVSGNSSIYVVNNDFKNITHQTLSCNPPGPCLPNPGVAIWATEPQNLNANRTLKVGGSLYEQNKFTDCGTGIKAEGYLNSDIQKNVFSMDISTALSPGVAVFIQNSQFKNIKIKSNTFNKFKTGIYCKKVSGSIISVDANGLSNSGSNSNSAVGIRIENALALSFLGSTSITNNTPISGVQAGIYLNGTDWPNVWLNKITLGQNNNTINNASTVYYGIRALNSRAPTIDGNEIKRASNIAPGNNPPSSFNNGSNSKLIGISVESSNNSIVKNNNLAQMATGVRFFNNTIIDADFLCNYMVNCQRGVTIEKCDIGNQGIFPGNPPGPIDDQWFYSGTFQREADVMGFFAPQNKYWYVRDLSLPFGPGPQFSIYINPAGLIIPILGNTSALFNCTNPCGTIFQCKQKKLAAITQNQSPYNFLSFEEQFLSKQAALDALWNEPQLLQQGTPEDSILQSFKDSILQTNLGKIRKVKESITNNNFSLAMQENTSIIPGNLMEENSKTLNEIYLHSWAIEKFEIDSADIHVIKQIAFQNPIDGGVAVYSARVMLGIILDDFSPVIMAKKANSENPIELISLKDDFFISKIYPNPSSGTMQVDYLIDKKEKATLEIMDISGKIVSKFLLDPNNDRLVITKNFSDGIYFYCIKTWDKVILIDKIVVIK